MDKNDINIKIKDEVANLKLITLEGALDTLTAPKLDGVMSDLMRQEGLCIIVDCKDLTYINSTGLASLILYHIQAKRRKGAFKLVALKGFVKEAVDVSGAASLLGIYRTDREAIDDWELSQKAG